VLEGLKHLLDLQRLDDELGALEREHAAIPANRSRIAESRQTGQARVDTARRDLAAGEVAQRGAEKDLQDREALLQKLEGQQFQVRSNEAYTALLHEMDAARRAISDCETRILESMDVIETSRDGLRSAERAAREEGGRLDAEEKRLAEREVELTAEIARLREERVRLVAGIAAELRERYERIASRRRPAVVLISKELCEGCRVDIPPQSYIEILRGERVVTCGQCQRILVHQEKLAARSAP
jgi:predicted  nucleic acid-binding Zn-ribbon protein